PDAKTIGAARLARCNGSGHHSQELSMFSFRASPRSPRFRLRPAGMPFLLAAALPLLALALPLLALAQPGTRTGPVVGPQGTVIDSPVVVPPDAPATSVEAAFQSADQNKDGFLSPAEAISVPALA